jgi:hypothetical protein
MNLAQPRRHTLRAAVSELKVIGMLRYERDDEQYSVAVRYTEIQLQRPIQFSHAVNGAL